MPQPPRIPRATYRLQLNAEFTLRDALAVVPYLDELGVSHLYVSSFLKARPGSTHGYDIVDHNALNPEIGDEADLDALAAELERRGMGMILDYVPNHMGIGGKDNAWWLDVLEWGPQSPYAAYFDIDWRPGRAEMRGKVLFPFLGDHYGAVLERGELVPRFDRDEGTISVWYWDHRLPINPAHYARLVRLAVAEMAPGPAREALEEAVRELQAVSTGRVEKRAGTEGRRRAAAAKARLAELSAAQPEIAAAIDSVLEKLAGTPGEPASFAPLHRLLERQHYRVSFWRVAATEINYRRFFDINDLAGLRQDRPQVFETTHRLAFRLLAERKIHGLRIDHIDGLYNPAQYCQRLQRRAAELLGEAGEQPLYLLVEKILAHHETLRRDWPVAGTTGYEFMNEVNDLFVDQENADALETIYARFIGQEMDFETEVREAKRLITRDAMASELHVLGVQLGRLAGSHWRSRDFTIEGLREALREIVAHFPIYRTYFTPSRARDQDKRYVGWAVAQARKGAYDASIYDFLHAVLDTSLARGRKPLYPRRAVVDLAMRVQQYSGPVMAKGFEDTALYRYNRLISLNEVGGEPRRFGTSPASFHRVNRHRVQRHPHTMLATATHDSKRGEDVRARIDAISELPDEWRNHLERWQRMNQPHKREVDGAEAPERNDEYFVYQTMIGAWPTGADPDESAEFVERLCAAAVKAAKEAKRRTSWAAPNEAYEQALVEFIRRVAEPERRNPFLDDFLVLQRRIGRIGMVNGLAQTLLKLTSPGVPDIYQGCELWQLALVDPDNRRPVDYERRRRMLREDAARPLPELLRHWDDGAVKLGLLRRVLSLRREAPELFAAGAYQPLQVRGERAGHVVAFARQHGERLAIVVAPRLVARLWPRDPETPPLGRAWRAAHVEVPKAAHGRALRDVLSGEIVEPVRRRSNPQLPAERLFARFPAALLVAEDR